MPRRQRQAKERVTSRKFAYKFSNGEGESNVVYLRGDERAKLIAGKCCEICGTFEDLCVDHCHTTGLIRGTLCGYCNRMLGFAKDNVETLAQAIIYLQAKAA